jgi:DNA topoisomerase-1
MPKKEKSPKQPEVEKIEKVKKDKDTTLIITEKPAAALKIAESLGETNYKKYSDSGVPFYEFERDGKKFIVGCAVGHLFGISQKTEKGKKAEIPTFDVEWKPNFEARKADYSKKYYTLLKKLVQRASHFIVATDYDIEGEVIGLNIIRFIAKEKDAKRMKFSSLTKDELNQAYEQVSPHLNWGQGIAGEARHYIDWFYGINLSRALMRSLSKAGRFRIMSIGRVQGPALAIVVDKEKHIKKFKPEPYWQVFLLVQDLNKKKVEVKFPKDITKESELLKFKHLKGKKAIAETQIKEETIYPPIPFDLTTLQTESYRFFGLTPTQTLKIAQQLYLEGLISYPRTSSQKYPEAIGYNKILKTLEKRFSIVKYAINKKPTEGKKTDPAHPAIYPTGEFRKLEGRDKDVYDLIVHRFVSCFCLPAIVDEKTIIVSILDLKFYTKGVIIKEKNWINVYKADIKEQELPTINGEVEIKEIRIEQKMTQPPKRYSEASLLKELEKKSLGTKSTRASIIETLYERGYIKERSIEATPLGEKLIDTLKKYSPIIVNENLTRELEKEMDSIQTASKELEKKQEHVLEKAKTSIRHIIKEMRDKEEAIGKELAEGNEETWQQEREDNTLTQCPKCRKGNLRILYAKAYKRFFVGCSNYPECRATFSLPPNSLIRTLKDKEGKFELCQECKFPLLLAIRKEKRPWKFCFNPECKTNEEWMKKKQEAKEQYKALEKDEKKFEENKKV